MNERAPAALVANVHGSVDPVFARVRDAFATNLAVGDDLGASVAVFQHGRCVVDLTGGETAKGAPYPHDALQLFYSVTKGVTTFCLMHLATQGKLELDALVTRYWPDFGEAGKDAVTVRQMLSHQAGLCSIAEPVTMADLSNWDRVTSLLAAQRPYWTPGTAHGYHALTFGFLAGELVRRISGKSVGTYLQDVFAQPMGLDLFIGLPPHLHDRVQRLFDAPANPALGRALADAAMNPRSLTHGAFANPPIDTEIFNDPAVWAMELPGANGIGSAISLAALYSTAIDGPLRQISAETVNDFRRECVFGDDLVLTEQPTRFGAGFMLPCPRDPMLSLNSFGHNGRGGSLAFADPESGIAFAYVGNRLNHEPSPHTRLWRLLAALREAL
ncbi:serine hydrolase domain-containing protein [Rhizobium sp. C4]|uniref:serine hydrolase domain-containing protein n=1 Tax=Rhizobium sp. C4 TaxID=1349800 RepID=UPI001E645796|nr:serine hydrolase domain-containing protein [Rhizobium sp. C4]MCD2172318.1 beta-lactamase family protein [Rhizobium sp. C4]